MSASSDDPQVSQVVGGVYSEAQPYISDIMQESARLYGSDVGRNYYPGSTVVDFSPQSRSALDLQQAQGFAMTGDSPFYDMAATTFGGLASGAAGDAYMNRGLGLGLGSADPMRNAYSELQPQGDYLSGVRSGILSDVMCDVHSSFGGMGRTGTSPGAQQAVSRGFSDAYAPIAQSAAEAERARELDAREAAIGRQFIGGREALDRLYSGSQADIARQQQAREAMFGRMGAGATGVANIQDLMDQRRAAGIGAIADTGAAYEDLAGRTLQDRINRYEFEQRSPYDRLNAFMSPILSIGAFRDPSYEYSGGGSRFGSALGSAQAGYNLGSQFGGMGGTYGAILGGLGGLLG